MHLHRDLLDIRAQLAAAVARIDRLLASSAPSAGGDLSRFRLRPGGPLSPEGETEMHRRFEIGEIDSVIARAMGVSVQGVQKRRSLWNATRSSDRGS
jgi:hypothetical protein